MSGSGIDCGTVAAVDVVLPCLNEVDALPWVLSRMPPGFRPIVVDNGSTDGSADLAERLGATVVRAPVPGYGSAVSVGVRAATAEVVAVMDCDATLDPADLPRLVDTLSDGADLVVGRRRPTQRSAWPWHARMANRLLAARVRRRGRVVVTDIGPVRVARREPLLALGVVDQRFGYPLELLVRAGAAAWRVDEADVAYRPRVGRSKVTGTVRGSLRAVKDMARVLVR